MQTLLHKEETPFHSIQESLHKIEKLQKQLNKQKEKIEFLKQRTALNIRNIIESQESIDPNNTDFEITWNKENKDKEGYFTVDFTYSEGAIYDPFSHPNFTLYSIETEGSIYKGDTSAILYVTYKYNPNSTK